MQAPIIPHDPGGYVIITAGGELHAATAPALRRYVTGLADQQPGRDVILDLAGVSFAGAAGVSALVAAGSAIQYRAGRCGWRGRPTS